MISAEGTGDEVYQLGPLGISGSIKTSMLLTVLISVVAWLCARKLKTLENHRVPDLWQTLLEGIYLSIRETIEEVVGENTDRILPFVGTLWIFILSANLIGLIPGFDSPTVDLSVTASLALLVFFSVHWFGIRIEGMRSYLRHYITPCPLLLPFHLIGEISRTLALAIRLFGNLVSLEMVAALALMIAGLLVPIPLLMLHIIEAILQAYLFGILALIYIAGALHSHELRLKKKR